MFQVIPIPWGEKPLLKLRLSGGYRWACSSPGGAGFGDTLLEAYKRWAAMRAPATPQLTWTTTTT